MNMFCGSGSSWGGWHMGGWFMPGFFLLVIVGIIVWLVVRRQQSPVLPSLNCPSCSGHINASYFRCPHCGESLKHNCPNCSRVIEHDWSYCPYCNENQASGTPDEKQP
jgi:RNA polymerase subunit RPABC4/transcription elongation factor Spt4